MDKKDAFILKATEHGNNKKRDRKIITVAIIIFALSVITSISAMRYYYPVIAANITIKEIDNMIDGKILTASTDMPGSPAIPYGDDDVWRNISNSKLFNDTNASTECPNNFYLDGNGVCIHFNNTILSIIASTTYNASSIEMTDGTLDAGNLASIQNFMDGLSYNVSEETNKDFQIYINFTSIEDFDSILIRAWYDASDTKSHDVEICLWHWGPNHWHCEFAPEIIYTNEFKVYYYGVFDPENHVGTGANSGEVRLKLLHDSGTDHGRASHDFLIDYAVLIDGFNPMTTTAPPTLQQVVDANPHLTTSINSTANLELGGTLNVTGKGRIDGGLLDTLNGLSADVDNRLLKSTGDLVSVDWDNWQLSDSGTVMADWSLAELYEGAVPVVKWTVQELHDNSGVLSLDWGTRQLFADDGTDSILDWSTIGTADFGDTNITTTGNIGIGAAPSYPLDIQQSATNLRAISIDGTTNDFTDNANNGYGINMQRDIDWSTNDVGAYRGAYIRSIYKSSDATVAASKQWVGIWSQLDNTGSVTDTGGSDYTLFIDPLYFEVTDTGTWDHDSTGKIAPEYRGLRVNNNMDPNLLETGGQRAFMTYTVHGAKIDNNVNPATMTGGTWYLYNTGLTINAVTGTTEGISRGEGIRINSVTGSDSNSGIVLDQDNAGGDIVFGEGQDVSIYFDGTDLQINTNTTKSGASHDGKAIFSGFVTADGYVTFSPTDINYAEDYLTKITDPKDMLDNTGKLKEITLTVLDKIDVDIADLDRPMIIEMNFTDESNETQFYNDTAYPYTKTITGTLVDGMAMSNRLMIAELNAKITALEERIKTLEAAK